MPPIESFSTLDPRSRENQYQAVARQMQEEQAIVERYFSKEPVEKLAEDCEMSIEQIEALVSKYLEKIPTNSQPVIQQKAIPKKRKSKTFVTNELFAQVYNELKGNRKAILTKLQMSPGSYDYHKKAATTAGLIVSKFPDPEMLKDKSEPKSYDIPPQPEVKKQPETEVVDSTNKDGKKEFVEAMKETMDGLLGAFQLHQLKTELDISRKIHSKSMEIIGEYVLENVLLKEELMAKK